MKITYNNLLWDTIYSEELKNIKDTDTQLAVVKQYFGDSTNDKLALDKLQLAFELAVMSAKYKDVMEYVTKGHLVDADTVPIDIMTDWDNTVIDTFNDGYDAGYNDADWNDDDYAKLLGTE